MRFAPAISLVPLLCGSLAVALGAQARPLSDSTRADSAGRTAIDAPRATGGATRRATAPQFYLARPFGSERQFNPLSQLINEGFNNLALHSVDHRVDRQPWQQSLTNLGQSLLHVEPAYRRYGWRRALRNELLPLTGREGAQWLPNYQDHLFGSGMVSARLVEWFEAHQAAHPVLLSYLTMSGSHVLNELVERPDSRSVDALADLLIFDNLGFVAFRSARVRDFVARHIEMTNWAGQPVITGPDGTLENASQNFVVRTRLPGTDRVRLIYFWGITHLVGPSVRVGADHWLSLTAGEGGGAIAVSDSSVDVRTVTLVGRFGLFLDERGSLLASLIWLGEGDARLALNIYPGALPKHRNWPGLYVALPKRGLRVGITSSVGLGLGIVR